MTDAADPSPHAGPPVASPGPVRCLPRWSWSNVKRGIRRVAILYAAITLLLFLGQDWLIFPGAQSQGRGWARVHPPTGTELVHLETSAGDRTVALYGPALKASRLSTGAARERLTLIFFYGNGGCLADYADRLDFLRGTGVDVLIPEFVGYGQSSGRAGEKALYETATAAWRYLVEERSVPKDRILIGGESLGGAVAINLASRVSPAGLITFSTFTSMVDNARRRYGVFPVDLLLRHRFESLTKMPRVDCPSLMVHGDQDVVVPLRMRDQLASGTRGSVTRLTIPGAGHSDVFEVGGGVLKRSLRDFVGRCALSSYDDGSRKASDSPPPVAPATGSSHRSG